MKKKKEKTNKQKEKEAEKMVFNPQRWKSDERCR
jgi:hypothetical protein